ncbi:MAG TPA: fused MFS/spermidine synthase [Stellaceae bacterium]|nr:fused MFS/spermidine synthase [Stellaceae bacterium]
MSSAGALGARASAPLIAAVYTATILLSAVLIFWIEPLFPKMMLPILGGTPATWVTALMFYQAALLLGYGYSFLLTRAVPLRYQVAVHMAVLALAAFALPPALPAAVALGDHPVFQVLLMMAAGIGAPLLALSASAPLLQHWFTRTAHPHARDPYFLYAASNIGSLGALLAFPVAVEPMLGLGLQTRAWAIGYAALAALILACASLARSGGEAAKTEDAAPDAAPAHPWRERALWLALAAVPSSLLAGTTTKITTEAAAGPLFWVVPLALYLLTFALAFARRRWLPLRPVLWVQTIATALIVIESWIEGWFGGWPVIAILIAVLFLTAYVCNCRLADSRPGPERTGEYYLVIALGGLIGGTFNALVAPSIFPDIVEYPLVLVLAMALRPAGGQPVRPRDIAIPLGVGAICAVTLLLSYLREMPPAAPVLNLILAIVLFPLSRVPVRLAAGVAVAFLVTAMPGLISPPLNRERNFFGVVKVLDDPENRLHLLVNGSILHGLQSTEPSSRDEPTSYYHRKGPLGDVMALLGERRAEGAAVIGLGAGTVACYGAGGPPWTFYEINPAVVHVASDPRYFSFLRDCQPEARIRLGDGRLLLASEPGRYPLIILDAFSSDAVPTHLLTLEALSAYLEKLAPDGIIAVNVSNRFIDLPPILAAAAERLGLAAAWRFDVATDRLARSSNWVALARSPELLAPLLAQRGWSPARSGGVEAWTDDRSDLFQPLLWHMGLHP